jgi:hypothetical protein
MVPAMPRSRPIDRGDFQTPAELAERVAALVPEAPASIVEPTCGAGSLLIAALRRFPDADAVGLELDPTHLVACRRALAAAGAGARLRRADFFATDWPALVAGMAEPILVIGNPPWVTNAVLGAAGSTNLPAKSTAHLPAGVDPRTGGSNFDISEWMLWRLASALDGRRAVLAMLCKTQVARRLLRALWSTGPAPSAAELFPIDAAASFGAATDAGLLVLRYGSGAGEPACLVHRQLDRDPDAPRFGLRDGELVSDLDAYDRYGHLATGGPRWRSGIKHDCARVLELTASGGGWHNGLGESVDVEPELVYPLLKSADLDRGDPPTRAVLVPQRRIGDDTEELARTAPRAWRYLQAHGALLDGRKSRVYRDRPRFSIFGVGDYSFAPYKVAISGFYKRFRFRLVGPHHGRPVLVDDTCYFLPFDREDDARAALAAVDSEPARRLLGSLAFWDSKRPITARLLSRLDLSAIAGRDDRPAAAPHPAAG